MVFDKTWEKIFQSKAWGKYPAEEVVRFIATKFKCVTNRKKIRVLDLGCGGGAHTWYMAREGFDVYGIDGSKSAIRQTRNLLKREGLRANVTIGDFTGLKYQSEFFDIIIDSSSVQHNSFKDIRNIHHKILLMLKPGGYFFGILLNSMSMGCGSDKKRATHLISRIKYKNTNKELFVHYFTEKVFWIMSKYKNCNIEQITRTVGNRKYQYGHYIVSGQKSF